MWVCVLVCPWYGLFGGNGLAAVVRGTVCVCCWCVAGGVVLRADGNAGPGWRGWLGLGVACVCAGCVVDRVGALQVMQRVMRKPVMPMVRVLQVMYRVTVLLMMPTLRVLQVMPRVMVPLVKPLGRVLQVMQ